jgi:hypothetical protein
VSKCPTFFAKVMKVECLPGVDMASQELQYPCSQIYVTIGSCQNWLRRYEFLKKKLRNCVFIIVFDRYRSHPRVDPVVYLMDNGQPFIHFALS